MKKIYLIIAFILFSATYIHIGAQNTYGGNIIYQQLRSEKSGGNIEMEVVVDMDGLRLKNERTIVITPVLRSLDSKDSYRFAPAVITTGRSGISLKRSEIYYGYRFEQDPQWVVRRTNGKPQTGKMELSVPFEPWMGNAALVFEESVVGCADCPVALNELAIIPKVVEIFVPEYEISYVSPPVEPVKERSETYSAYINYEVGKYTLLRDYKGNAATLAKVDKILDEIRSDTNLVITQFSVTGYASPEGNFYSNQILSENRARSFVDYLRQRHGFNTRIIRVSGKGEDWEGLRREVSESNIQDKDRILDILDIGSVAQRKQRLMSLAGGSVYRMLLRDFYPPLRRNDYTITYVARAFDVEEAKLVIKTKPQYLSLNEMFLVAHSYEKDSKEFKEVFDIAVRMYPDQPIAQLNTAATEIEKGALDAAIDRLQQLEKANLPQAWNNLGVAYIYKKEYQNAMECFKRGVQGGDKTAAYNMEQLSKWLEQQ